VHPPAAPLPLPLTPSHPPLAPLLLMLPPWLVWPSSAKPGAPAEAGIGWAHGHPVVLWELLLSNNNSEEKQYSTVEYTKKKRGRVVE